MTQKSQKELPLRVGLSSCLLGEKVRFDGGHKKDRYLTEILGGYFEWVMVCPELEVGMGVPREAVRLVGSPENPQMVGTKSGTEWTDRMVEFSDRRVKELARLNLCGFIFKSDSPSCGMERVRVYSGSGMPAKNGRGLFASVFIKGFPLIPVEEEGRLNDEGIRENFIVRVFSYHRLLALLANFNTKALVQFHTIHKFQMLAHSPKHYSLLGRLVANAKSLTRQELMDHYSLLFTEGLAVKATVKKHTNVLQHILGYLRPHLSTNERADILESIEEYHRGLFPLVVPITLLKHYIKKLAVEYVKDQVYLNPHPRELMLRNHV